MYRRQQAVLERFYACVEVYVPTSLRIKYFSRPIDIKSRSIIACFVSFTVDCAVTEILRTDNAQNEVELYSHYYNEWE
jgi:hypothetical protein